MPTGEEPAWDALLRLDPEDVCKRAKVTFDSSCHTYVLKSFSQDVRIFTKDRVMSIDSPVDEMSADIDAHSRLLILSYLIYARDIPLSDELVSPVNLPGGEIYSRGTHALPLDKVAEKYGDHSDRFITRGRELGGEVLSYGDASFRLFPLPRVPVVLILWREAEEFPARSTLLFDSTCKLHLPPDILWSTAMMSVRIMLADC